jgi:hypothetical protein
MIEPPRDTIPRDAISGEVDVAEPDAGMNGEIIDTLLALLDQRVLVALPIELHRIAADLLQRLVDGHSADRHRRVPDDPFARGVDVAPRGEVHHRVGAPADRPHHLLDLLLDRRGHRRVADIGVDLGEEVAANDHRLRLEVIDVGGDNGASARDLAAHELWRDEGRDRRAEALAVFEPRLGLFGLPRASDVFAMSDIDHLLCDDPGAREFELGSRDCRKCREMAGARWQIRARDGFARHCRCPRA